MVTRDLASGVVGNAQDERTLAWVNSHADWLRLGGIAVAVIILIAASVSWIGILILAVLLGLYEFGVHRLVQLGRQTTGSDEPPAESTPGAAWARHAGDSGRLDPGRLGRPDSAARFTRPIQPLRAC